MQSASTAAAVIAASSPSGLIMTVPPPWYQARSGSGSSVSRGTTTTVRMSPRGPGTCISRCSLTGRGGGAMWAIAPSNIVRRSSSVGGAAGVGASPIDASVCSMKVFSSGFMYMEVSSGALSSRDTDTSAGIRLIAVSSSGTRSVPTSTLRAPSSCGGRSDSALSSGTRSTRRSRRSASSLAPTRF